MLLDHVCTMHIHMLLDNDAYVHDAYICDIQFLTMLHVCMMRLKFCDQPTNEQGDSSSRKTSKGVKKSAGQNGRREKRERRCKPVG